MNGLHASYEEFVLPLFGEQAARGASAAIAAVEALLGRHLDQREVGAALGSASTPGRLEVAGRRPLVVLDGAHNPDAARALAIAVGESFQWERLHLIVAMFEEERPRQQQFRGRSQHHAAHHQFVLPFQEKLPGATRPEKVS